MPRTICLLVACAVAGLLSSCGNGHSPDPRDPTELMIHAQSGDVTLMVEIADTEAERERGLMGRRSLAPNDGMAFVFDAPTDGGFWMKDTLIPLSIAFWDKRGRIVSILDMNPCTTDPCRVFRPMTDYVGAVEVRQGVFDFRGVDVGDRVELIIPDA